MKTVLVTGDLGFIGFNFVQLCSKIRPEWKIVGIDSETYAAQFKLQEKKSQLQKMQNILCQEKLDINDSEKIAELIIVHQVDTIINFAAESHVDNSIKSPMPFFKTNISGTATLLELARRFNLRFHQIGTDEVYGPSAPEDDVSESSLLLPSSPYSSSKASADLIALSYAKTFGTNVTVSRCTNNIGPWQHCEKLVPTVISNVLQHKQIPIYGSGLQRRHWIDVDDHNKAVIDIVENGTAGEIYNIAPADSCWISNLDMVKQICSALDVQEDLVVHVADRVAHDQSYYLTSKKLDQIRNVSKDQTLFADTLMKVVSWYKAALMHG